MSQIFQPPIIFNLRFRLDLNVYRNLNCSLKVIYGGFVEPNPLLLPCFIYMIKSKLKIEGKRLRKEIDYREHEFVLPYNAHKTSDWTSIIKENMHIRIYDKPIFQLPLSYTKKQIYLECLSDDAWKNFIDIEHLSISPEYKTLVDELKTVYDANNNLSEYFIDTYVSTLFHIMKMNDYPLSINAQHELNVDIGEQEEHITSIPDFIIRSRKSKMLVVVEDKNTNNAKYVNQWKENRVFITSEYIRESLLGLPTEHYMDVHRYPSPGTSVYQINALDFCKLEDRKIIVEYLSKIRDELKS